MNAIDPAVRVRRFSINTTGRDFIVGDIHGCFSDLADALGAIGFDPDGGDRLFSVGDLVDRGPESEMAIKWLDQPWFFAVAGNHEDMAIRWSNGNMPADNYIANGGAWNVFQSTESSLNFSDAFNELPIAIEIETADGLVGIVHADCPTRSWDDFAGALKTGWVKSADGESRNSKRALSDVIDAAQWSRSRIEYKDKRGVEGVRAVVVGHTPLDSVTVLGNVHYIDTGACYEWGCFTIMDASTLLPVEAEVAQ